MSSSEPQPQLSQDLTEFLALGDAGGQRAAGYENIFLQGMMRCQSDKERLRQDGDVSVSELKELTAGFHGEGVGSKRAGFCVLAAKLSLH